MRNLNIQPKRGGRGEHLKGISWGDVLSRLLHQVAVIVLCQPLILLGKRVLLKNTTQAPSTLYHPYLSIWSPTPVPLVLDSQSHWTLHPCSPLPLPLPLPSPLPLPLPLLLPLPLPPTPCLVYVHIHQCLHLFIKLADSSKAVVVVVPSSTMWGSLNTVSFPMQ